MSIIRIKTGLLRDCRRLLATLLLVSGGVSASDLSPQDLVREASSRMLGAIRTEQEQISNDAAHLQTLVSEILLPYFDFRRMSQWVLYKNWRRATPAEQEQFVEQFRLLLVRTYSTALSEYADEKITYLPVVAGRSPGIVTVATEIEPQGTGMIPIDYSMFRSKDGWKVYDISISGVSLVTTYRSTYNSIIRKKGVASLIDRLAKRNREEAGG